MIRGANQAQHLAVQLWQCDEHPEGDDQRETDAHDDVRHRRAHVDDPRCAVRGEVLKPRAERLQCAGDPIAHFLALQDVGIAIVQVGRPRLEVLHDGGQVGHEVDELVADAEHRREDDNHEQHDDGHEQHIRQQRANRSVDTALAEPFNRAAQDEHEHDRPHDDADGVRQDARKVHDDGAEKAHAHKSPDANKAPERLVAALLLV